MTAWNLGDVFEAVVDAVPDRPAVASATLRLSYAELDVRVSRLAREMRVLGVQPGDRVGILLRNRVEYLETMLAAFKLRAAPVNLHCRYTEDELRHLLDDAEPRLIVHEPDLADRLARSIPPGRRMVLLACDEGYERIVSVGTRKRPIVLGRSGDDRYLLYTGGTTGLPKGVVWRHEDLFFAALSGRTDGDPPATVAEVAARAVDSRVRCLPASPYTHGTAHWTALGALFGGGTVVVSGTGPFDPVELWDQVQAEAVTLLVIVGDAFARPLADALDADPDRWDLGQLLSIVSGGAVLSPAVRQALLAHLPWSVVVDGYGTSETGGHGHMAIWPGQPDGGPPRFEVSADTVVFDEELRPLGPGTGEVGHLARSGRIPLGYFNDLEHTERTFPVIDGVRWAIPGDLAMVEADGRVRLLGRGSSSINSGGEKVFPDEVEAVLKGHRDVFDAVVLGQTDERWGERVVAVVQLRPGAVVDPADLADHVRDQLADFKVPRLVVTVPTIVRHSSGKPDLRWAREVVDEERADATSVD